MYMAWVEAAEEGAATCHVHPPLLFAILDHYLCGTRCPLACSLPFILFIFPLHAAWPCSTQAGGCRHCLTCGQTDAMPKLPSSAIACTRLTSCHRAHSVYLPLIRAITYTTNALPCYIAHCLPGFTGTVTKREHGATDSADLLAVRWTTTVRSLYA